MCIRDSWKTLRRQALPLENLPTAGLATGKPSNAGFCQWKTLQRRILPPENLSTPGIGLGQTSLTASDLEAEALAVRVKVHWAIWLRSGSLTQTWCLDARFWCQKRTHSFEVVPDGLVMGGLGMGQGGVWTGSYKGFACFGKGVSHILLRMGEL